MSKLITTKNLTKHDDVYQMLVDLHDGLSNDESRKANSKLVLLLANHIGDPDIISEAVNIVKLTTKS